MASARYDPVSGGKRSPDDEDGLVDEWGVRYEGHTKPGGGRFGRRRPSRRRYLVIAGAAIVLLVIIVIIVVAVRKHSPQQHPHPESYKKWVDNSNEGVTLYPKPKNGFVLIKYDGPGGYAQYTESLESQLHDYLKINQQDSIFTDCTKDNSPPDKVCRFDAKVIGPCDSHNKFGYPHGRPCVMLKLNLPINQTAEPFENTSAKAEALGSRYDPDYIGVTCDGETKADQGKMAHGSESIPSIEYYPSKGFPAYWFRSRTIKKFLPPIVMVKFNSPYDATYIRIKCTAWAKNFAGGHPENSTIFSTSFVMYSLPSIRV